MGRPFFAQFSISAQHYCRGWRPRQPVPSTFRLQSHLYYPHNVALHKFWIIQTISPREGSRISAKRNCAAPLHSLCVKSQYFASICCKLELCSQNTCRTSAHKHTLQENVKIVIHGADTFVYLQIKGYDLFISIYL